MGRNIYDGTVTHSGQPLRVRVDDLDPEGPKHYGLWRVVAQNDWGIEIREASTLSGMLSLLTDLRETGRWSRYDPFTASKLLPPERPSFITGTWRDEGDGTESVVFPGDADDEGSDL